MSVSEGIDTNLLPDHNCAVEQTQCLTFKVLANPCDFVVAQVQGLQARQHGKAFQLHDGIVREVHAVKLILHSKIVDQLLVGARLPHTLVPCLSEGQ